jgi:glutaredoxin
MGAVKLKQKHLYIIAVTLVIIGVTYYFLRPYITGRAVEPGNGDGDKVAALAQCLTDKGVVLYGTKTCPHCANQKKAFGDAVRYINYVECTTEIQLCREKGISSVPAWEIDGMLYLGERTLDSLAEMAGCPFE